VVGTIRTLTVRSLRHAVEREPARSIAAPSQDVAHWKKPSRRQTARERGHTRSEREVDERLEESFPASDPPSWDATQPHRFAQVKERMAARAVDVGLGARWRADRARGRSRRGAAFLTSSA
jgi:hypothetical protein